MAAPGNICMSHFDVIVLGAGPAGCAAAITCAQRGLRVALLEKCALPRYRPGETLHPGVEPLFNQLGITSIFSDPHLLRHTGHWVQWEGLSRFHGFGSDTNGPWRGIQLPRALLDQQLLEQAKALGVEVRTPYNVTGVMYKCGRVQGVESGSTQWTAEQVVDATGGHGWLQRQLQIPRQAFSPTLIARYGYCQASHSHHEHLGLFAQEDGWYWIARISAACLHWTRLGFTSHSNSTVPECLGGLSPIGPTRGADVTWRLCLKVAGPGYFLAGDASGTLDPCASHGVLKAVMSGMQVAFAIVDCLSSPANEHCVKTAYQTWVHDGFERDLAAMRMFYRTHPHPPGWI